MKKYIKTKTEAVGMYITDAGSLSRTSGGTSYWLSHKQMPYLPLLNWIQISPENEVRLASGESIGQDITTYNEHHRLNKLNEDILTRTKLDVTANDLFIGPIEMALNFSGKRLTITSRSGIPKSFAPLSLRSMPELDGKLVILSVHTINSVASIHNQYGYSNYLKTLKDRLVGKSDYASEELSSVYDYVLTCLQTHRPVSPLALSDTFKVVTLTVINVGEGLEANNVDTLALLNRQIEITYSDPVNARMHDNFTQEYILDKNVMETIRAYGLSCFIVDSDDKVSERYINFAGTVRKIPKIKSGDKVDGLYLVSVDASQKLQMDSVTPLNELDSVKFVYKSEEEADKGANMKEQYSDQLDLLRIEKANEALKLKAEHEKEMRALDQTSRQRIVDMEHESRRRVMDMDQEHRSRTVELDAYRTKLEEEDRARKLEHEEALRNLKLDTEVRKQETEHYKYDHDKNRFQMDNASLYVKRDYEHAKYERDSTIETIKTVGAVAGLLAGGYAIYTRLAK